MNPSALLARVREITLARTYVREQPLGLTMATALSVVDLSANAITPAGHFISERCLGHDSKALIRRFPPVFRRRRSGMRGEGRKCADDADIDDSRELDSPREKLSLNCYDGSYEFAPQRKSAVRLRPRLFRRAEFRKLALASLRWSYVQLH